MQYIDLPDLIILASDILDTSTASIQSVLKTSLAESALGAPEASFGDEEFYPEPVTKAAILCARLVQNHPLPDGNKRLGWYCMREFMLRNDIEWSKSPDVNDVVETIEALASHDLTEEDFIEWLQEHVA